MDYKGLIEGLKGLITDKTSTEDAEKIGGLINTAEQLEADHSKVVENGENTRKKYIELLKTSPISKNADDPIKENKPKSFEDCVNDVILKRKK